ncbi:MAG: CHASE2 domain-containing protein [Vulcanimicrobiota bacterium]
MKKTAGLHRILMAGFAVALFFLILPQSFFSRLEFAAYDEIMVLRGERNPDSRILIVALDEKSRESYSPSKRDRKVIARLVDILHEYGAATVVLDITFPHGAEKDASNALAESMRKAGNVFCPVRVIREIDGSSFLERPEECIEKCAASLGHIEVALDDDGVIRKVPPVIAVTGKKYLFLPLQALGDFLGLTGFDFHHTEGRSFSWGRLTIPLAGNDTMYINYCGPSGHFPRVSLIDVFKAYNKRDDTLFHDYLENFRGKLILVGATGEHFKDNYLVPFRRYRAEPGQIRMPGIEIQANVIQTILTGNAIRKAPGPLNALMLILLSLLCALILSLRLMPGSPVGPWSEILLLLGLSVLFAAVAFILFGTLNLWIDIARPLAAVIIIYALLTIIRMQRVMSALFTYVPGAYHVIADTFGNTPGVREKEITVVFLDIEGYTELSSTKTPTEIFEILRDLYGSSLGAFTERGGEIITYLGDAAMITFGAFKELDSHPEKALLASVDFKKRLVLLNEKRMAAHLSTLRVGIGIATGIAAVGILGKAFKEVSVIGSTTNMAARLQGLSKVKGCVIVVNSAAYRALKEKYPFTRYETSVLKGLGPVVAYGYELTEEGQPPRESLAETHPSPEVPGESQPLQEHKVGNDSTGASAKGISSCIPEENVPTSVPASVPTSVPASENNVNEKQV